MQNRRDRDRKQRRVLVCGLVGMFTAAVLSWAQSPSSIVQAHAVISTDAAHAGSTAKLAVVAQIAPGFHINDHKPSIDYLIPTQVKLEANDQFSVEKWVYPKGTLKKFPFSDTPLSVYEGKLVVGVLLHSGKAVAPGSYTLNGKFAYQACNDHACFAPTSVPLAVTVRIVPPGVPLKAANTDVFQSINFQ